MNAASPARLQALLARETALYVERHPRSAALAAQAAPHFLFGLPMHWMRDWALPHPLMVQQAQGHEVVDVDGHRYVDFCLGDSAALFGHSPPPLARAVARQAAHGLSAMLPGEALAEVGALLRQAFGLPRWQLTLSATDANRFALRWARAVTGRPRVLVFEGCYHGTVDDCLVDVDNAGRTVTRASLLGQVHDLADGTVVVPFNDLGAVRAALAAGDVAAVLTEPALTNCGLVPPQPGFLSGLQSACREAGVLLILDETHTLSAGPGGMARQEGLAPDLLVIGKAVAGGVPCAVYGFTDALAERMAAAKAAAPEGHSGIGTTLSGSLLALAALRAQLQEVMTPTAWAAAARSADALAAALQADITARGLPWSLARLGSRMELQFCASPPVDARAARAAMNEPLERALHLYWLNRGVLVTPFHNMLLVAPSVDLRAVDAVRHGFRAFLDELGLG